MPKKRMICPNCGGELTDESIGWKCKRCRGFVSYTDGKFYEYIEKTFMPPVTNADKIRFMDDIELATFLKMFCDAIVATPCDECPLFGGCAHDTPGGDWIKWVKEPVKGDANGSEK